MKVTREFWRTRLPVFVLAAGGLVFLSLFAMAASDRALSGHNDFLPFYAGGRLAFSGHLYDPAWIVAEQLRTGGASGESLHFIRPPWFAAALWPLARLDYRSAYGIWELVMAAGLGAFTVWWTPAGRMTNIVLLCFSLPALAALVNGQDTPLLLAWLTLGLILSARGRPFAAGLILALCQTKFHLFLPLWLILVAGRRWRLLGGLAAGNAALAAAGFAIAGWNWPIRYLASISRDAVTPGADHMPTFYHAVAALGWPGWWVLGPVALVSAGAWFAGRRLPAETAMALAPALAIPFLKHTYTFDAVVLMPILALSLTDSRTPVRVLALLLLTPVPWMGCFAGYPASLLAPALILALAIANFRLKGAALPSIRGSVREVLTLTLPKLLLLTGLSIASVLAQEGIVRVTETDAKKAVVSKVEPEYPAMARNMHLSGRAVVDVYFDQDGKVEKAEPVSGNPLLTGAAVSAVKKWKFNNSFGKKAVASFAFDFKL